MKSRFWLLLSCCYFTFLSGQTPSKPNAVEIFRDLKKLNFLGTVLYIAAHPDDENTRLISYFSNQTHAQTYYLALTRGDGGQNLLGSDLKEALGLIRTQELLKARSIDGGHQRFTRAIDFGYSKSPEETLNIWNKDSIINDMVWTIRHLKPDVIINRFDHRTPGTTHGHHTASAMLSVEAFDLAPDPEQFKSQLKSTSTWQPKRLFFNTSWWFYGSRKAFKDADKSNLIAFDIGQYYPDLGLSNSEIASLSRSQHKSQAFGNTPKRGEQLEYLEIIKGDLPQNQNIFEGIDTSWNRVKGGQSIQQLVDKIIADYNFSKPYHSIPDLLQVYKLIQNLDNLHWKRVKTQQVKAIIKACLGLYIESVSESPYANANQNLKINTEIINRSPIDVNLLGIEMNSKSLLTHKTSLKNNQAVYNTFNVDIHSKNTLPYWLNLPPKKGLYQVEERDLLGLPETPNPYQLGFSLKIENTRITFYSDLVYKYNDPVDGEVFEDFEILPKISIKPLKDVAVFKNGNPNNFRVQIKSYTKSFNGQLTLDLPESWKVEPQYFDVNLSEIAETKTFDFKIKPPENTEKIDVKIEVHSANKIFSKQINTLDYKHIPKQVFTQDAKSTLVNIKVDKGVKNVGYIKGAGDKIPDNLKSLGYNVEFIDLKNTYSPKILKQFDAIILGIRAFNTEEQLISKNEILFDYVKQGGTLITQYTTTYGLLTDEISPLKLNLYRNRVTDETAEVQFIDKTHKLLNYPNQITSEDFKGWVQERGLYFPDQWDKAFQPILKIQDYDDKPTKGSLLVAPYGDGYYIYTGLSLFRQIPAGVPGAFRLLSNMLSINSNE
ncbi:PIG-L family deacetylase [Mesohalobacter halotolerans]|uniref:PIG-L family deacetylase n=1 Tax=Mesohalobacter halotolerans TaxID=1883405 RepID=A0A4U5TNQ6_9FLAO|nr:PIG-L family deacetylase [Mesohalobacter halotolerans]TKS55493.1 PIG-L family deacetylase [Mesohalobacter halotolerans]